MTMSDGGKGSKPRPFSVSQDEYDKRWDAIFGRDVSDDTDDTDEEDETQLDDEDADTDEK